MSEEIPYQLAPQIEALKQERANCVAYGNDKRVEKIDWQLAELGVKLDAAEERGAAVKSGDAKADAPQGRRGKDAAQTTAAE